MRNCTWNQKPQEHEDSVLTRTLKRWTQIQL
uniref:Uncharacterized protein n=1 Tax=Lepeophtheirus salmonis TaxID=72036 RepID=A0A0K2UMU3_LEPSM